MINKIAYPVMVLFLVAGIYSYFTKYAEYKCVESANLSNGPELITTGTKVYFFADGGVYIKGDTTSSKIKHIKVEGTEFISYLRSNGFYSYKLDKKDLTYFYRLGNRDGQCTKVSFLDKLGIGSFESVKADNEYDY